MTNKEIKKQLKAEAVRANIPDVLTQIKCADLSKTQTHQNVLVAPKKKFNFKLFASIAASVAALILIFAFAILPQFTIDKTPYANITVSINPSVELVVNKNDMVIEYIAGEDSDKLIDTAKMINKPLDEVIENIIYNAKANNYLDENEKDITVDVVCSNASGKKRLQDKTENCINQSCGKNGVCGKIKWRGGR